MIKSELIERMSERNPHLFQRDVEHIVNAILEEIVEVTIAEHVSIRDGVAARDPVKAGEAMRHHLNGAAARLDLTIESFSS